MTYRCLCISLQQPDAFNGMQLGEHQRRAWLILNIFSNAWIHFNNMFFLLKFPHDFAEVLENGVKPKQENRSHHNLILEK